MDEPELNIASDHATRRVPTARPNDTVAAVRHSLAGADFECAGDVAVVGDDAFLGIGPIERLLAAPEQVTIADVMDPDPPVVTPNVDQESVAWEMVRRGESSVAVLNGAGEFAGLVPPHRMLRVLLAEHDEDLARLGGYLASTRRARQAAEEPIARRLWHRLPWLIVGLIGAMASAALVGAFEDELESKVLLAVFIPALVYMADAVGTQTEALLIRGLSLGVTVRRIARRELATGIAIGLVLSAAFMACALVVWGEGRVALAVGLALLASCSIATVVARLLPWLFQRLGRDPAFGSGPLATVIQDLLSILVYFAVATAIAS